MCFSIIIWFVTIQRQTVDILNSNSIPSFGYRPEFPCAIQWFRGIVVICFSWSCAIHSLIFMSNLSCSSSGMAVLLPIPLSLYEITMLQKLLLWHHTWTHKLVPLANKKQVCWCYQVSTIHMISTGKNWEIYWKNLSYLPIKAAYRKHS